MFVVVTRFEPEGGRPIVHTYGPWPTRAAATAARGRMQRSHDQRRRDPMHVLGPVPPGKLHLSVCMVLDGSMA